MKSAFTLIEILIVVILLGILAAIVIPQFSEATTEAETNTCDTNKQAISAQAELYKFKNGSFPATVAALVTAGYLKTTPECPGGGTYAIDTDGVVTCTVH